MKRITVALVVLAGLLTTGAQAAPRHHHRFPHHPECRTIRCARHADHLWARHHPTRAAASGWTIPEAIVMCESGGANLAPNGASASGYYQIIRSTWESFGGTRYAPEAYLATRRQQGMVAARIWASGGPEQWVCKG